MTDKIARTKITSEDCVLPQMTGKYDLVFYASQRARAIISGSKPLIEGFDSAKNHAIMIAMEEIRQGKLRFEDLMESLTSPFVEPIKEPEYTERTFRKEDFREDDFEDEDDEDLSSSKKLNYKSDEEYED
jgi:DNA-directed RNA polymerase omega subunit